ncbi:MAG: saccharopine dehydrogenase C-terminal domain-containing protein [Phycisphaerales bacterium]
MNIIVLGAGMVGSVIAADLAREPGFSITVADARAEALERTRATVARVAAASVSTARADLSDPRALAHTIGPFDLVVGALASTIGFQSLKTIIECGKNFADICFMPQDYLSLDSLAKSRGVTAIVDCGVAPGMSNMISGFAAASLNPCSNLEIYVGGLPVHRRWPFDYKAAFSPYDVIEEYTRPARLVEHGKVVIREALSEPQLIDLPHVGTLEAFNTDGLRSLAYTLSIPFMKEKTLRYPGHIELMRAFRHTGLFSHDPIRVGGSIGQPDSGALVRPIDLISALMFPKWTYDPGEPDLTVMRVIADGVRDGRPVRLVYDLFDTLDPASGFTSMSRTTAFPCAIAARLLASGRLASPGVIPPEFIGMMPGMLDHFLLELEARGVKYRARELSRDSLT